ncbi:MAG: 4-hydroxy-3-methylbut-2-enyl diphosphate reductase [Candidatus Delongbacteria bacterium]|nr:4-hydroxy-3-methylbut-2-enyl diphosphate reductase [Candidatus Delongbacteria bacterium]
MKIKVVIDKNSGVCGGVKRAIGMIEKQIGKHTPKDIYVNGELLHNRLEMERLMDCGLKVEEDVESIRDNILFIRTHGVSKNIKKLARKNKNIIIDATCPKVSNSQKIIEEHYADGYQIIIVGKLHHPEVQGLLGYCNNEGVVVSSERYLNTIDFSRKSLMIAQTTVSTEKFNEMVDLISPRIKDLKIVNTICPFVEKREKELIEFAKDHSVIVFIGGTNSSNTKVMFEKFSRYNKRSYLIENKDEIDFEWFKDGDVVGVSGSASTPAWQIEEVKNVIEEYFGGIIITDYVKDDFDGLIRLWTDIHLGGASRGDTHKIIKNSIKNGGQLLVVKDQSGNIVGSSWLTTDKRRNYLHHFGIREEYRKTGLSKRLLEKALDFSNKSGLQIKLEVHKDNKIAIKLYEKYGFKYLGDYLSYIIRTVNKD